MINGEKTIDINFGDEVITTRVNGINYKEDIEYSLTCNDKTSKALRMKIMGVPSFKSSVLVTNKDNLGVELLADDKPIVINDWLNFTYPTNNPKLQAVPVKVVGSELAGGEFFATATLLVDYQ